MIYFTLGHSNEHAVFWQLDVLLGEVWLFMISNVVLSFESCASELVPTHKSRTPYFRGNSRRNRRESHTSDLIFETLVNDYLLNYLQNHLSWCYDVVLIFNKLIWM
ncbi:MAG: hypothetical protein Q8P68_04585 [Candidatus Peregrinibacteria bacterium]|nr:hypothetical protein [Candidatus Peregrinibacteria bacterium]MDZ4244879.1 hypothetical protein [Candidatus Gracilibacteria bacterium]